MIGNNQRKVNRSFNVQLNKSYKRQENVMQNQQALLTGNRIKARREELGYTQTELGELVGKTQKQIYLYEKGESLPSADGLVLLAKHLDTSPDWLLGFEPVDESELSPVEMEAVKAMRRAKDDNQRRRLLNALKALTADTIEDATV